MASSLVVETGAGLAEADSYASLTTIDAYATKRGLTFVIGGGSNEADADAAARRAFVWLNATYRGQFTGRRTQGRAQAGEWPRINAHDRQCPPEYIKGDVIPQEIIDAQCEVAIYEKAAPSGLSPSVTPAETIKRLAAGSVEIEYAIGSGGTQDQRPVLTVINDILGSLLAGSASSLFGQAVRG